MDEYEIGRVLEKMIAGFGMGAIVVIIWAIWKLIKRLWSRNEFTIQGETDITVNKYKSTTKVEIPSHQQVAPLSTESEVAKSSGIKKDQTELSQSDQIESIEGTKEFPYNAELKRRIFAYLVKEEKDEPTMIQARVECDGDNDKVETTYYRLRYQQIVESGKIERFKKVILMEKAKTVPRKVTEDVPKENRKKVPSVNTEKNNIVEREGTYIKYDGGVVKDTKTGLDWYAGPDRDTSWYKAMDWVKSLDVDGGVWRMPTVEELSTLYLKDASKTNMTPLMKTKGSRVWTGEVESKKPYGWTFLFIRGFRSRLKLDYAHDVRAFAVRSRRDE